MQKVLKIIIACFVFFVIIINQGMEANGTKSSVLIQMELQHGEIVLEGVLIGKEKGSDPIEASTTSGGISIHFNANLGDVTISIVNINGGTVYSTFINSAVQTTLFIPSQNFPSGTYSITISNGNGSASGNFSI